MPHRFEKCHLSHWSLVFDTYCILHYTENFKTQMPRPRPQVLIQVTCGGAETLKISKSSKAGDAGHRRCHRCTDTIQVEVLAPANSLYTDSSAAAVTHRAQSYDFQALTALLI